MERIPTSRGDSDKVATAAWPVSPESSETGDHAIFSVDSPCSTRPRSHKKYTSTSRRVNGSGVHRLRTLHTAL